MLCGLLVPLVFELVNLFACLESPPSQALWIDCLLRLQMFLRTSFTSQSHHCFLQCQISCPQITWKVLQVCETLSGTQLGVISWGKVICPSVYLSVYLTSIIHQSVYHLHLSIHLHICLFNYNVSLFFFICLWIGVRLRG